MIHLKQSLSSKVKQRLGNMKGDLLSKIDQIKKTWNPENLYGRLEDQALRTSWKFSEISELMHWEWETFMDLVLLHY